MDSARVDHFLKVCLANWDVRVLNHTGEAHDCNLSLGIPWGKHTKGCGKPTGNRSEKGLQMVAFPHLC